MVWLNESLFSHASKRACTLSMIELRSLKRCLPNVFSGNTRIRRISCAHIDTTSREGFTGCLHRGELAKNLVGARQLYNNLDRPRYCGKDHLTVQGRYLTVEREYRPEPGGVQNPGFREVQNEVHGA